MTMPRPTLLVSLAHPDDESFGSPPVGTILRYAQAGAAVHLVCATRGEAGTIDAEHLRGYDSVAALRTQELHCAAQVLGLAGVHFLDYRDSGMENSPDNQHPDCLIQAPIEAVAEKITYLIRQLHPQVVLTFDPSGGYFHPDHIRVHRATTLAFQAAGDPTQFSAHLEEGLAPYQPQKLYYMLFSRGLIKAAVKLMPLIGQNPAAFGRNKDINLKRTAAVQQQLTTRIGVADFFKPSRQAAACHASQIAGLPRIPNFVLKWFARYETYTRIAPPFQADEPFEDDLFAGVHQETF